MSHQLSSLVHTPKKQIHLLYLQEQNKKQNQTKQESLHTDANCGFTCKRHNLEIIRLSRAEEKRAGKPQKDLEETRLHITKSKKPVRTSNYLTF